MIFFTIRTTVNTISMVVSSTTFIQAADLFENAPNVINFKVCNGDSILTQEQCGVSGYSKWVIKNYDNK